MSTKQPHELTNEERVLFGAFSIAADLAAQCRQLRDMHVSVSATALEQVVNTLMTDSGIRAFPRRTFAVRLQLL